MLAPLAPSPLKKKSGPQTANLARFSEVPTVKKGNAAPEISQSLETTITRFAAGRTHGQPEQADLVELFARTPPVIKPGAPTAKEPDGAKVFERMPMIYPGTLQGDSRAAPVTPEKLTAIVLDLDKLSAEQIDQAFTILDGLGHRYAAHTTYSHNPDAGRHSWRVWVDVSRPMSPEEHAHTARVLIKHFPQLDPTCAETSRAYFMPAIRHEGAPYETRNGGTEPLPVLAVDLDDPALLGRKCPKGRSPRDHGVWLAQHAPPAVEGQGGHAALLSVCRALCWGLELSAEDARAIILEHYNPRCVPPFDFDGADRGQLDHKIESASQPFEGLASGYLLPEIEAADVLAAARAHYRGSVEIGVGTPLFGELAKLEASGAPEIEELWSDLQDARYSRWQALRNATKKAAKQLERRAKRADGKPSVPVTHPEADGMLFPPGYSVANGVLLFEGAPIMTGVLVLLAKCPTAGGTHARIAFRSPSAQAWKTSVVPYADLVSTNTIHRVLANHGVNVTSLESAAIVGFVRDYVATNEAALDRPIATETGWHESGAFVWGREVIDGPEGLRAEYPADNQTGLHFVNALRAGGDREASFAALGEAVTSFPTVAVCVAASIAACYARPAGRSAVGVHLGGTGGTGKTRTIKIAASVWGSSGASRENDASGLVFGSNSTIRALEGAALHRRDLPFMVCDLRPFRELPEIMHAILNGAARARSTTTGGTTQAEPFACGAVITEGEFSALAMTNRQGFHRRMFELAPDGTDPESIGAIWRLGEVCSEHYGHLGPACVRLGVPPAELYARESERLAGLDDRDLAERAVTLLAVVSHVAPLLGVDAAVWRRNVLRALADQQDQRDEIGASQADRAAADLNEILIDMHGQIADTQEQTRFREGPKPWVGYRDGDRIVIRQRALSDALKAKGHHATTAIIAALVSKGLIVASEDGRNHAFLKRLGGVKTRCYIVDPSAAEEQGPESQAAE